MLGYTEEDFLTLDRIDITHPDDREENARAYDALFAGETDSFRLEKRYLHKEGGLVWADVTVSLVRDADGRALHTFSQAQDISARRRAEYALRDNEARLQTLVDNAADGIITIDQTGSIESFNLAAESMFGYTPKEAVGRNVRILMPEPDKGEHDTYLLNFLGTGKAKIINLGRDVVGRRKDGTMFPMHLRVSEVFVGGRLLFMGLVHDITERKRAETEVQEARDLLADAVESISEGFILFDADERLILCNSTYRDMYPFLAPILDDHETRIEDIVRLTANSGQVEQAVGNEEAWTQMRLEQYRTTEGTHEQYLGGNRWVLASERRTKAGGGAGWHPH